MAAVGPRLDKSEVPFSAARWSLGHFGGHLLWVEWKSIQLLWFKSFHWALRSREQLKQWGSQREGPPHSCCWAVMGFVSASPILLSCPTETHVKKEHSPQPFGDNLLHRKELKGTWISGFLTQFLFNHTMELLPQLQLWAMRWQMLYKWIKMDNP